MQYLSQCKSITLIDVHGPIIDPTIGIKLDKDKMTHLEHLKNQSFTDELKFNLIRECLKTPVIA